MRKILVVLIFLLVFVSCTPESKIKNIKNPESVSEYYDNLSQLYSFAVDLYSTNYENLKKIKIRSSSYAEFSENSEKIRASVNKALGVYYKAMMEQLQYSIATNLDPSNRVMNSLDSKEREVEMAKEKYNWILTEKNNVGSEQGLNFAESVFAFTQSAEELKRLTELIGD